MAVKNLYYSILSDHPEYKYAYDLTSEVGRTDCSAVKCPICPTVPARIPPDFRE